MDMFVDDAVSVALYSDGFSSSHPISVPVNDPSEIGEIFDTISYEKVCFGHFPQFLSFIVKQEHPIVVLLKQMDLCIKALCLQLYFSVMVINK